MKKQIILLIICGLIIFVIGGGAGIYYQIQKDAPQLEKSKAITTAIKSLSSKVIPTIYANGKVAKISGRIITLSSGVENTELTVPENVKIYSFSAPTESIAQKSPLLVQTEVAFGTIKVGDKLNVSLKVSSDGQVNIISILIIPET